MIEVLVILEGNDFTTADINASLYQAREFYGQQGRQVIQINKPFMVQEESTEYEIVGFEMAEFPYAIVIKGLYSDIEMNVDANWFDKRRIVQ